MSNRLYLLLGRTGDLISFLPVLHHEAQHGPKPMLMVAKECAAVLDGVSYIEPVIFDGGVQELSRAFDEASKLSGDVKCVQVAGPPEDIKKYSFTPAGKPHATTDSFIKETWKLAGHFPLWKDQPPLVFDRRDKGREAELRKSVLGGDKRKLILIATHGVSSPFPAGDLLQELLRLRYRQFYKIVNLSVIKAERFYDLLTFYERARCLISIDTAALHLAPAIPKLPVCAIVNDKPTLWAGSAWRPNHIFHCRYSDWQSRACEMLTAIDNIDTCGSYFFVPAPQPRIVHAFNGYDSPPIPFLDSWHKAYDSGRWIMCRAEPGAFGRDSQRIPYIKDILRMAAMRAEMSDIICLTRSDIGFHVELTETILANAPCYAHRSILENGKLSYHPATDLFAFTKKFWLEHHRDLPDLLLGPDATWHRIMREWIALYGGKRIDFVVYRAPTKPTKTTALSGAHNDEIAKQWFTYRVSTAIVPKVSEQVPTIQINRRAISPFGYNPSLVEYQNGYLLSHRWHSLGHAGTSLAITEMDDRFNAKVTKPVALSGANSFEDMKFFKYKGEIWCSYIESNWPTKPTSIVRYGKLEKTERGWTISGQWQVQFGKNDGSAMEKNWCFWENDNRLFCIYQSIPEQIVLDVEGYKRTAEYKSEFPHWKWGEVKGGVMAGFHKGKLLRFFHSTLDNEASPDRRRYYIGAALMEPKPPFETIALSSEPIARGSETCDLTQAELGTCTHYKPQVIFPGGVVRQGDNWLLSVGLNDAESAILKLDEKSLKL